MKQYYPFCALHRTESQDSYLSFKVSQEVAVSSSLYIRFRVKMGLLEIILLPELDTPSDDCQ